MASALAFAPAMAKNIDQVADLMTRNGLTARFTGNTASPSLRIESFFSEIFVMKFGIRAKAINKV